MEGKTSLMLSTGAETHGREHEQGSEGAEAEKTDGEAGRFQMRSS